MKAGEVKGGTYEGVGLRGQREVMQLVRAAVCGNAQAGCEGCAVSARQEQGMRYQIVPKFWHVGGGSLEGWGLTPPPQVADKIGVLDRLIEHQQREPGLATARLGPDEGCELPLERLHPRLRGPSPSRGAKLKLRFQRSFWPVPRHERGGARLWRGYACCPCVDGS